MKKIIFTAAFWLVGCVSLPQLGDSLSAKPLDELSPEQSRLVIYLDAPVARYHQINIDNSPSLYILPNSFQEVVLESGVHNLSAAGFFFGQTAQSVMPLLGLNPLSVTGWVPESEATQFSALPATTHYLRLEIHSERSVRECDEDRDTISICPFTYDFPVIREVVETEALEQIAEYREVLSEDI